MTGDRRWGTGIISRSSVPVPGHLLNVIWGKIVAYKFEQLEVWQLALEYIDLIYTLAEQLPRSEEFNLKSQIIHAATSVALNIAEGSTSQSDAEQARFLGFAVRSLIETVACQHLISRRGYLKEVEQLRQTYSLSRKLFVKIQAFRNAISNGAGRKIREEAALYETDDTIPF